MSLFKNLVYFCLSLQEKFLCRRLSGTISAKNFSGRKRYALTGVTLNLDSLADSEKARMEEEIVLILKSSEYKPEEILKYVKNHGTEVYYIESPKQLNSVGEDEGFIYPARGAKALYLSLLTRRKFSLKTDEMFVLSAGEINKYYFIYHFYNWYAFKHGITGLDSESVRLLRKYLFECPEEDLSKLQLADIYKLKDAIKQDKSAIEFVFKLCRNYEGAKQAVEKLKNGGANL